MDLEHSFTVPVPEERAWDVLLDVERVAPCMPGATLDSVDGGEIKGRIRVKVGPIAMTYAGTARFVEQDRGAHLITLEASGKETRGAGTASAKVRSVLADQGDQTHVVVRTSLNVTGKPAQFGRGVLSEVGGKLIGIFAANLAEMLAAEQPGQQTDAAAEPLEELHLPLRSYNSLRREGVHTVGELASRSAEQLLAIDNIGPASVQEIRKRLAGRGLALAAAPAGSGVARASAPAAGAESSGSAGPAAAPADPGTSKAGALAAEAVSAPGPGGVNGSAPAGQAAPPRPVAAASDDDAIDLFSVAGTPVLKRALPAAAGVAAVALAVFGLRRRRRRRG